MTIYCQRHDNILISRMKKHLIFEKLEGYPNLAWAEFLPSWAFLDFFCKISTPDVDSFENWKEKAIDRFPSNYTFFDATRWCFRKPPIFFHHVKIKGNWIKIGLTFSNIHFIWFSFWLFVSSLCKNCHFSLRTFMD